MSSLLTSSGEYVVVARRYRPRSFEELVGQSQVAVALTNAIRAQRVGHAYLFTGARGVGKTSTARIFAKCLNCETGPTTTPCHQCDACQGIAAGEDVDVLEIDGASNRGIDEIRQLRANAQVRPSRGRFKVYIIDEVHMLTGAAFNALLKTLEEPPEHVKFIFCTTDPEKIPITVLSRCQRFDFPPVSGGEILGRLRQICDAEGVAAEEEALRLLARRAAGSLRDSQSLLEQLLSFSDQQIRAADVHQLLGTAGDARLGQLVRRLIERDAAGALAELDVGVNQGVDVGQLAEQLLGYLRDLMAAAVGCGADLMRHSSEAQFAEVQAAARAWGLPSLLAASQILDQTLARMRQVTHARTLVETALVRMCQLQDLELVSALVARLQGHAPAGTDVPPPPAPLAKPVLLAKPVPLANDIPATKPAPENRTKADPKPALDAKPASDIKPASDVKPASAGAAQPAVDAGESRQPPAAPVPEAAPDPPRAEKKTKPSEVDGPPEENKQQNGRYLTPESAFALWKNAVASLNDTIAESAAACDDVAISGPNTLAVRFRQEYNLHRERCESRKTRLEAAVCEAAGFHVRLVFETKPGVAKPVDSAPTVSRQQRVREAQANEFVAEAMRLFDADVTRVDPTRGEDARRV